MKNEQTKNRTMDINQRKQELFRLLATHERCTFAYLADALDVSKRTVKRYLDELEQTVPLKFTVGRYNGGVQLLSNVDGKNVFKNSEILVLEKIVLEAEKTGSCTLNTSEIQVLKGMLYRYYKNEKF